MRLNVVVPFLNNHEMTSAVLDSLFKNLSGKVPTHVFAFNNGGKESLDYKMPESVQKNPLIQASLLRLTENVGVYPFFWIWKELPQFSWGTKEGEEECITLWIHNDLFISEKDWDVRLLNEFERTPNTGLIGFIGSYEIDPSGGRGRGTGSNFQGNSYSYTAIDGDKYTWHGSGAEVHGQTVTAVMKAAVVDGCAMAFRMNVLAQIEPKAGFPPHHFYDRLLSCQVREFGYDVEVLGIECDHISGQTANTQMAYHQFAEKWAREHLDKSKFVERPEGGINWDATIYQEAERQWFKEFRDEKQLIPVKI